MTVGKSHIAPFVGIQNITDDGYNGLTRLNALGGRFFEPSQQASMPMVESP